MALHDYGTHCERCGKVLTLAESANGGLCETCLDKCAREDDEKRPPEKTPWHCDRCGKEFMSGKDGVGLCPECNAALDEYCEKNRHRGQVLLDAHKIINGERQDQYGNPEDSFTAIASLWNGYLDALAKSQDEDPKDSYPLTFPTLSPKHVAQMMALMKIGRTMKGAGKADSFVDCVGYIALAADIESRDKAEAATCQ